MNKQISDEQIDQYMRTLLNEAAVDKNAVNEIADSPKLWWGVQRQITTQKADTKSPWPPAIWRRVLLFAAPAAVVAALIISFLVFRPAEVSSDVATNPQTAGPSEAKNIEVPSPSITADPGPTATRAKNVERKKALAKPIHALAKSSVKPAIKGATVAKATKTPEFKSEFIALSYARNAESGQIVRVKVPSSMMVSLGLVSSVNKSSDLVDAEVIVGDDGLTRAIRFIR